MNQVVESEAVQVAERTESRTYLSGTGQALQGHTLPGMLYDATRRYKNPTMFNQREGDTWTSLSLHDFQAQCEEIAVGLREQGLAKGDRVALYMESNTYFCLSDMGCLIGGLINVPIYLNQSPGTNEFILRHSGARALFVSSLSRLHDIDELLAEAPAIRTVIVAEPEKDQKLTPLPEGVQWLSLETIRKRGADAMGPERTLAKDMVSGIDPEDLATIVYTSGPTGEPKGVMLSHENISCNALTAIAELEGFKYGPDDEVALSFLPMSHIFARTLYYADLAHAISIFFSDSDHLAEDLKTVRPTLFATVPRVLEKVYGRILEKATLLKGPKKKLLDWSLDLAADYEIGAKFGVGQRMQLKVADALVFRKWRAALGGRVKFVISGGAALNEDLANMFAAAGVNVLQGYGLTETSPIITFNRPGRNRAGTVGEPLPGVEVKLAEDGEILTRGHHVMKGYFNNPDKTREVMTDDGWFHTGDIGQITSEGFLRITDRKKALFKLSTGKYVMPQPLENRLSAHPLIEQAVVVGPGQKYCAALIFVDQDTLRIYASAQGLGEDIPIDRLVRHPKILLRYQELVELANEGMDHWMTIKRFRLMTDHLSIENGMLTPTLKVKRKNVHDRYRDAIDAIYLTSEPEGAIAPEPSPA
jgi:long-chain acyl-CoA synthetase